MKFIFFVLRVSVKYWGMHPFSLARLRVQEQLTEVLAQDLRFLLEETKDYFQNIHQCNLLAKDLLALDEKAEGWIASLQLIA